MVMVFREYENSPCSRIDSPLSRIFHNSDPDSIRTELTSEYSNLNLYKIFQKINPVDFDQAFGLIVKDVNDTVKSIRAVTLQFKLRGDHNYSGVVEDWEEMFISWSKQQRNDDLDISVFTSDT